MSSVMPLLAVEPGCALTRLERRSRGRDLQIRAVCECGAATDWAGSADAAIVRWRGHAGRRPRG